MNEIIKTGKELARILGVSQNTICNYLKKGMPYIQMPTGRKAYNLKDVEDWLLGKK